MSRYVNDNSIALIDKWHTFSKGSKHVLGIRIVHFVHFYYIVQQMPNIY